MVLAGGCVSGCLYKAATGNLNSIAALLAMPFGMALVEYGPLSGLLARMKTAVIHTSDGSTLGLPDVTGIPYSALALLFAIGTLLVVFLRRSDTRKTHRPASDGQTIHRFLTRPWKPWQAGLAIGILAAFAYVSSAASGRNYPLGVTHGVLYTQQLITDSGSLQIYKRAANPQAPAMQNTSRAPAKPAKKIVWWLVLLVVSEMLGSFVSGKLSGQARLLPKPPDETVMAMVGGFLVGVGAVFATGCVIGNILSGWALMSLGMLVFGVVTVLANWATTYLYLMGGGVSRSKG